MAIEYRIISTRPTNLRKQRQSVWLILKDNLDFRIGNLELSLNADLTAIANGKLQQAWQEGAIEPKGARLWEAQQQSDLNETYDKTLYEVTKIFRAGGDLTEMLAAGRSKLSENVVTLAQLQRMEELFLQADEPTRRKFTAMAITVLTGKVGQ